MEYNILSKHSKYHGSQCRSCKAPVWYSSGKGDSGDRQSGMIDDGGWAMGDGRWNQTSSYKGPWAPFTGFWNLTRSPCSVGRLWGARRCHDRPPSVRSPSHKPIQQTTTDERHQDNHCRRHGRYQRNRGHTRSLWLWYYNALLNLEFPCCSNVNTHPCELGEIVSKI
ncbi:hypothetical protein M758_7G051000 [Ceratodon purpureus]|nr:hypothetical protein M758_7G051000 [Ceratodon purpureus]